MKISVRVLASLLGAGLLAGCADTSPVVEPVAVQEPVPLTSGELRAELRGILRDVNERYGARSGIAVATRDDVVQVGLSGNSWAWSTIKVPVAVVADREGAPPELIEASIGWSDNYAAYRLSSLIEADLGGLRFVPELADAPGETVWKLADQARYASRLPCTDTGGTTYEAMGEIVDWQQVGLARIPGAHFKGGWGADSATIYTLRQLGTVDVGDGVLGIALITHPDDRSHTTAEQILDDIATELRPLLDAGALGPAVTCRD